MRGCLLLSRRCASDLARKLAAERYRFDPQQAIGHHMLSEHALKVGRNGGGFDGLIHEVLPASVAGRRILLLRITARDPVESSVSGAVNKGGKAVVQAIRAIFCVARDAGCGVNFGPGVVLMQRLLERFGPAGIEASLIA